MRIGSGTNADYNEYNDGSFEAHAAIWKNLASSNIEKVMGR